MTDSHSSVGLTPAQKALVAKRLAGAGQLKAESAGPTAENPVGTFPLSPAQERLWYLYKVSPASPAYNVPRAYRLRGALDIPALQQALNALLLQHAQLRVRFAETEGVAQQIIVSQSDEFELVVESLGIVDESEREHLLQRRLAEAVRVPFKLQSECPFRARVFSIAPDDHAFLLELHHIVTDEWSLQILTRDLAVHYAAFANIAFPQHGLSHRGMEYTDYVKWERARLGGVAAHRQLEWWKSRLKDAPIIDVPGDKRRPALWNSRGAVYDFEVPARLYNRCVEFAQHAGTTPFVVLLTAFGLILQRYTGVDDIVIGTPVAGRTRREFETIAGFFVNMLPVRADFSCAGTFRSALALVSDALTGALAHQDVPIDRVVEALKLERDSSRPPLLQVAFAKHEVETSQFHFPGTRTESIPVSTDTAKFDLTLTIHYDNGRPGGRIEYVADLYDARGAARMAENYLTVLESALKHADAPVAELQTIADAEREELLALSSGAVRARTEPTCIPELFARQLRVAPDAIAVEHHGERLTYAELATRASTIANELRQVGVASGDRVALCMKRSVAMVASMLGVLQLGAVYVPLDPTHPEARIGTLVNDSQARVVIVEGSGLLSSRSTVQVIDVATLDWHGGAAVDDAAFNSTHTLDAAYVIYTSGSTGSPKGVVVSHNAVVNLVIDSNYAPVGPTDVVAHAANPAFDAATWEVWGALLNGARIVIVDYEQLLAPQEFERVLAETGVTALFLTTAVFNLMVREVPRLFASLRYALFGGEASDPATVQMLLASHPPEFLVHVYGPTECTVFSTAHTVRAVTDAMTVPIGLPIAGVGALVLDTFGRLAPFGGRGELHIAGAGLALGYLNQPDLTSAKFVETNVRGHSERIYRTGDMVRLRFDGTIEFIGRMDRQLKIRGLRIEPGEIEAVVRQHPGIADVFVEASEHGGERSIVAYVVAHNNEALDQSLLQGFLKARLPAFMVPASIMALPAIPLTSTGKVDRNALPALRTESACLQLAPRDSLENQLAAVWQELLDVARVGVRDNFFDAGGHSLLAARLLGRIETLYNRRIPIQLFFANATIEQLAGLIRGGWKDDGRDDVVLLNAEGTRRLLFFLHGDTTGVGFYGLTLARHLGADQPLVLIPPVPPEPDNASPNFAEMARRHFATVRRIQPRGPYRLAGYCNGGLAVYEVARMLEAAGEKVERLLLVMTSAEMIYLRKPMRVARLTVGARGGPRVTQLDRLVNLSTLLLRRHRLLRADANRRLWPAMYSLELIGYLLRHVAARAITTVSDAAESTPSIVEIANFEPGRFNPALPHMRRMTRIYVPGRYNGKVTLFWTQQECPTPWDSTVGWAQVAREVEVVPIKGTHVSCVTDDLEDTGRALRNALRDDTGN